LKGVENAKLFLKDVRGKKRNFKEFLFWFLEILKELAEMREDVILSALVEGLVDVVEDEEKDDELMEGERVKKQSKESEFYDRKEAEKETFNPKCKIDYWRESSAEEEEEEYESEGMIEKSGDVGTKTQEEEKPKESEPVENQEDENLERITSELNDNQVKEVDQDEQLAEPNQTTHQPKQEEDKWSSFHDSENEWSDASNPSEPIKPKIKYLDQTAKPEPTNFLQISDLTDKSYKIDYIEKADKAKLDEVFDHLHSQRIVGIDSEFTEKKGATFIQISSLERGFIFNMNKKGIKFGKHCRAKLKKFLENKRIIKIGYSVESDVRMINRAFQNNFQLKGFETIENKLYLCRTSNSIGLSKLCQRIFGKLKNQIFPYKF
jgi:hypothetical protein